MMKVSNNPAANAIQEVVGGGDPEDGWEEMIDDAGATIGLEATSFGNRMGCGGPNNPPPINQTTLSDLGRIFEQMTTNRAVLFPPGPGPVIAPPNFVFTDTDAYLFMDNDTNELELSGIPAIAKEQGGEIGLDEATIDNFVDDVRLVHKAGSNNTGNTLPVYRTIAGWVSLPINGGADTRDYVYGIFYNNATPTKDTNGDDVPEDTEIGGLLDDVGELLRPVIREALEDF